MRTFKKAFWAVMIILMISGQLSAQSGNSPLIQGNKQAGNYIDYQERYVYARGVGFMPDDIDCSRRRNDCIESALETAEVIAKANLLGLIKGVTLEKDITINNMMKNSRYREHVEGKIRFAETYQWTVENERVIALVKMPFEGNLTSLAFLDTMTSNRQQLDRDKKVDKLQREVEDLKKRNDQLLQQLAAKEQKPVSKPQKPASVDTSGTGMGVDELPTGIILNLQGQKLVPVQFVRILDIHGNEIYHKGVLDKETAIIIGGSSYVRRLSDALKHDRIKLGSAVKPLVIKPIKSYQDKGRDWIISEKDAKMLYALKERTNILQQGRVIVALGI